LVDYFLLNQHFDLLIKINMFAYKMLSPHSESANYYKYFSTSSFFTWVEGHPQGLRLTPNVQNRKEKQMKNENKNQCKIKIAIMTLFLMLTMVGAIMPNIAVADAKETTATYVAVSPNPAQLDWTVSILGWGSPIPRMSTFDAPFGNFTFTITKPNGDNETQFVSESATDGTARFLYKVDQIGNYSVVLSWPGDSTREGATSQPYKWTVQETVPSYPGTALPNEYWEYPISAENREWYQISGGWMASGYNMSYTNCNPYSTGPDTAHILWKTQVGLGGLLGGEFDGTSWVFEARTSATGGAPYITPGAVSAMGRIWYVTGAGYNTTRHPLLHCLNQYTGEEIYTRDLPCDPAHPSIGGYPSGVLAIEYKPMNDYIRATTDTSLMYQCNLWLTGGGIWQIDPMTGETLYYQSGNLVGPYNDHAIYLLNYPMTGNLTKWSTITKTIEWTISDKDNPTDPGGGYGPMISDDMLVTKTTTGSTLWKVTTYNATSGQLLVDAPDLGYATNQLWPTISDGKIFVQLLDDRVHAVDLQTGKEVWKSEKMDLPWGYFPSYVSSSAYGKVYFGTWDGHLYCFDAETGKTVWKYYSGNTSETFYNTYPFWGTPIIADGKIYCATGEHSPPNPAPRGNKLYCLDANTGEFKWSIPFLCYNPCYGGAGLISSGMLIYPNQYDGCAYCFGKGPSAITVDAPSVGVTTATPITISGTVTDISPGASLGAVAKNFPNGLPCVSDESMSQWMSYVYQQQVLPANTTGVPVMLSVVDANGNYREIGSTTTVDGTFAFTWTPDISGDYQVIASFDGSDAYYPSSAIGHFYASDAATPAPTQQIQTGLATTSDLLMSIAAASAAIIVAIAIAVVLILRKRP